MPRVTPGFMGQSATPDVFAPQSGGMSAAGPVTPAEERARVNPPQGGGNSNAGMVLPRGSGGGRDDNSGFEELGRRNRRRKYGGGGGGGGTSGDLDFVPDNSGGGETGSLIGGVDSSFKWVIYDPEADEWTEYADTAGGSNPVITFGSVAIAAATTGGTATGSSTAAGSASTITFPDSGEAPFLNLPNLTFDGTGRLWGLFKLGATRFVESSDDFGATWTLRRTIPVPGGATTYTPYRISASDDGLTIVVSGEGDDSVSRVDVSFDAGASWAQSGDVSAGDDISGWDYMMPIVFNTAIVVFVATFSVSDYFTFKFRRSVDAVTWTTVNTIVDGSSNNGDQGSWNTVRMDDGTGIAMVNDGTGAWGISRSLDEGATWDFLAFSPNIIPNFIYPSGDDLYVVDASAFYKLADAATTTSGVLSTLSSIP